MGGGGVTCEVLPLLKGGSKKVLAMLKGGGHNMFWGSFDALAKLEVLAILKGGGTKSFHSLKGGVTKGAKGGGAKRFRPPIFSFCSPLPVIKDQSLIFLLSGVDLGIVNPPAPPPPKKKGGGDWE